MLKYCNRGEKKENRKTHPTLRPGTKAASDLAEKHSNISSAMRRKKLLKAAHHLVQTKGNIFR